MTITNTDLTPDLIDATHAGGHGTRLVVFTSGSVKLTDADDPAVTSPQAALVITDHEAGIPHPRQQPITYWRHQAQQAIARRRAELYYAAAMAGATDAQASDWARRPNAACGRDERGNTHSPITALLDPRSSYHDHNPAPLAAAMRAS